MCQTSRFMHFFLQEFLRLMQNFRHEYKCWRPQNLYNKIFNRILFSKDVHNGRSSSGSDSILQGIWFSWSVSRRRGIRRIRPTTLLLIRTHQTHVQGALKSPRKKCLHVVCKSLFCYCRDLSKPKNTC